MINYNGIVSEAMRVKPLKEGQSALYKLCDCDTVDRSRVDEETGQPKQAQPRYSLYGAGINIFDRFTGKRHILQNVTGIKYETMPDRTQREVPEITRVHFERNGTKSVNYTQEGTYIFMERHPRNRDNPFRDKTKKPIFYRVSNNKVVNADNERFMIMADTMDHIKNADLAELKAIYEALDPTAKRSVNANNFDILKRDLYQMAQKDPIAIMRCSSNKEVKMKIQLMDAEFYNIITFLENSEEAGSNRAWIYADGKKICNIDIATNKVEGLIQFFENKKEEGVAEYRKILAQLKKITAPVVKEVAV